MTLERKIADLARRMRASTAPSQHDLADAFNCAIDALDAGRADLVQDLLQPLVARVPGNARAWQLLGLAARDEQRSNDALTALQRAAQLAPDDLRIAAGHATAAADAGLPAARLWAHAVALSNGSDPETILSAAAALVGEGEAAVADAFLERATIANPAWVAGHERLASARWAHGGGDDFARGFAEAVRQRPDDLALRLAWYRALSTVKWWDQAAKVVAEARQVFGERPELDGAEAYIATETDDDARAETLFARLWALGDPGTRISHVRHCVRTGRLDRGEDIALAITRSATGATAWPYLSAIWRLKGDVRAAWLDGDPPFIRTYDLPFTADGLADLAATLRQLHLAQHHPAEQSLRGGTQTEGTLFNLVDPRILDVRGKVLTAIRDYVDALPSPDPAHPLLGPPRGELRFAGSWSVRLKSQGFHVHHTHPLGWISSALYIALPDVATRGVPPAGWLQLGAPPPDLRVDLPPYAEIEPVPGRLVMFPSTMWHGTVPFDGGERLTIAYDVAVPRR